MTLFLSILTLSAVDFLFTQQLPIAEKVQGVTQAEEEDLTQEQLNCMYYLNRFVAHQDQDELG